MHNGKAIMHADHSLRNVQYGALLMLYCVLLNHYGVLNHYGALLHPLIVPIAHTTIANMASIAPITTTTTTNSSLTINLGTTAMRSRRLAGLQHTVLYHSRA